MISAMMLKDVHKFRYRSSWQLWIGLILLGEEISCDLCFSFPFDPVVFTYTVTFCNLKSEKTPG